MLFLCGADQCFCSFATEFTQRPFYESTRCTTNRRSSTSGELCLRVLLVVLQQVCLCLDCNYFQAYCSKLDLACGLYVASKDLLGPWIWYSTISLYTWINWKTVKPCENWTSRWRLSHMISVDDVYQGIYDCNIDKKKSACSNRFNRYFHVCWFESKQWNKECFQSIFQKLVF